MIEQTLGELKAVLRVDSSSLDSTLAKAKGFGGELGKVMGVGAAVAAAGFAVGAVKMAMDFQQQMTLIRTQANDTTDNIGQLGDKLKALAGQVGQSPEELAKGFYHLASAGFTGAQAMDMLTQGAKLAAVGQSDMESTMQAVIFTMRSGLSDIHNATEAVSMLNAIVGNGDMRMSQLTQAMSSGIMPVAALFGVSMRSLGAALTYMTDRGVPADEATSRLRMSMSLMAAPTAKATKLLTDAGLGFKEAKYQTDAMTKALHLSGVSITQLGDDLRKPDGFMVALQDLKTHMDKAGVSAEMQAATISRAFGGGKSGGAIMMMYNDLQGVAQKFDQLGASSGNFGSAWQTQSQTLAQKLKNLKSAFDAMIIAVGEKLMPYLDRFAGWISAHQKDITNVFNKLAEVISAFVQKLADVASWMADHKRLIEVIGAALAAWWAIDKIAGWESAVVASFGRVAASPALGMIGRLLGGAGGLLGIGGGAAGAAGAAGAGAAGAGAAGAVAPVLGELGTGAAAVGGGMLGATVAAVVGSVAVLGGAAWLGSELYKNLGKLGKAPQINGVDIPAFGPTGAHLDPRARSGQQLVQSSNPLLENADMQALMQRGVIRSRVQMDAFISNWENANKYTGSTVDRLSELESAVINAKNSVLRVSGGIEKMVPTVAVAASDWQIIAGWSANPLMAAVDNVLKGVQAAGAAAWKFAGNIPKSMAVPGMGYLPTGTLTPGGPFQPGGSSNTFNFHGTNVTSGDINAALQWAARGRGGTGS